MACCYLLLLNVFETKMKEKNKYSKQNRIHLTVFMLEFETKKMANVRFIEYYKIVGLSVQKNIPNQSSNLSHTEFMVQQTIQSMKPSATSKCIPTEFIIYKIFENLRLENYKDKRNEKSVNNLCVEN